MLSKRTNILFDQALWQLLESLAKSRKRSVGNLVREAVREKYGSSERQRQIALACEKIKRLRPKARFVNYRELINDGRKW